MVIIRLASDNRYETHMHYLLTADVQSHGFVCKQT